MRVAESGFGGGMTREEMIALTAQIDLDGLRGYYLAVTEATQEFMRSSDFSTRHTPFDIASRLALEPEAPGPSPLHRQGLPTWTTPRFWLDVFTLVDVSFHIEDADYVLRLLVSDQEVD